MAYVCAHDIWLLSKDAARTAKYWGRIELPWFLSDKGDAVVYGTIGGKPSIRVPKHPAGIDAMEGKGYRPSRDSLGELSGARLELWPFTRRNLTRRCESSNASHALVFPELPGTHVYELRGSLHPACDRLFAVSSLDRCEVQLIVVPPKGKSPYFRVSTYAFDSQFACLFFFKSPKIRCPGDLWVKPSNPEVLQRVLHTLSEPGDAIAPRKLATSRDYGIATRPQRWGNLHGR